MNMLEEALEPQVQLIKKHLGAEWPFDQCHPDAPGVWVGETTGSLSYTDNDAGVPLWRLTWHGQATDFVLGPNGLYQWREGGIEGGFVTLWLNGRKIKMSINRDRFEF
jgi:hypothetical protein